MVFREAEILKQLNHDNIVQILNSFTLKNMQVSILLILHGLGCIYHGIFRRRRVEVIA